MKRLAPVLLSALVLLLVLGGCQTGGTSTTKESAAPAKKLTAQELEQSLGEKMFLLKDGRDMRFASTRVAGLGVSDKAVREGARNLDFSDFRAYLDFAAKAHRVRYIGEGRFKVDVLDYILGRENFAQAEFLVKAARFKTEGVMVDGVILERVLLEGRDFTTYVGVKVYELMLTTKVGL